MELVRLATVQPETVHVALACCRCDQAYAPSHPPCASVWLAQRPTRVLGGRADAQLSGLYEGENESRLWCGHCSALLSVTLRPALVHDGSDVLGYLDTINCRAVDCTVRKPKLAKPLRNVA
eukprot:COSAG04_NODE_7594_length_1101_cov_1.591816_1_plen_120_part_10